MKTLKERLRLKSFGCCSGGSTSWAVRSPPIFLSDDEQQIDDVRNPAPENISDDMDCDGGRDIPAASAMNLATALAAERQFRATTTPHDSEEHDVVVAAVIGSTGEGPTAPGTPVRMSLLRLLEETDVGDEEEERESAERSCDRVCCVCMRRSKGAAFIPCGHTFCRVCSRELWLNRGSCPLCNRPILEVLDLF